MARRKKKKGNTEARDTVKEETAVDEPAAEQTEQTDQAEQAEASAVSEPQGQEESEPNEATGLDPVPEEPEAGRERDDEMDRLVAENLELRQLAQRKQAEFENYRKRVERERADTSKFAAAEISREVLPVLDNLERATDAASQETVAENEQPLREGIAIIFKQLKDILEKQGLAEVEAVGQAFDPHVHEAVSRVETDEHPEGTVVEVFQKGYLFKDRLIRPSMVSVARPLDEEAAGDDDERVDESESDA